MELDEAIKGRRSVRKYNDEPLNDDTIRSIIQAGVWAPSACNLQQWKFIIINKSELFEGLYRRGSASFVKNVNQGVLVLYNNQTDNMEYNDYIQSASAAIQNMLLKAYSLNVGACWINNLPNKRILRKYMSIPKSYDPIALVALGNYSQKLNLRERRYDLNSQISYNGFDFNEVEQRSMTKVRIKRLARKIYKTLPFKETLMKLIGRWRKNLIINKKFQVNIIKYKEFILYFIFGVSTTLVNIIIYQGLLKLQVDYRIANLFAIIFGKLYSYFTNKKFVFCSKSTSVKSTLKEFCRFVYARGFTGIIDYFGLIIAVEYFNMNQVVMKYIIQIFIVVMNYILSKLVIFRSVVSEKAEKE